MQFDNKCSDTTCLAQPLALLLTQVIPQLFLLSENDSERSANDNKCSERDSECSENDGE